MNEYRHDLKHFIKPIAIEFFATFSRFEFALKRSGYLQGQVGGRAAPDWIRFGADLGEPFFEKMKAQSSARVFFDEPPKRLTISAGREVEFTDQAALVNSQMLLEAIGLVRNNLFHGEKPFFGERDEKLLRASLFVLDCAFATAQDREDLRAVCNAFRHAPINAH